MSVLDSLASILAARRADKLWAGDVNHDGAIDAMDLALVGRNVGRSESQWHQH